MYEHRKHLSSILTVSPSLFSRKMINEVVFLGSVTLCGYSKLLGYQNYILYNIILTNILLLVVNKQILLF